MQRTFLTDDRIPEPIPAIQPMIPLEELRPDLVRSEQADLIDAALLDGVPADLLYLMTAGDENRNLVRECWAIASLLNMGYEQSLISRASGLNAAAIGRRLKLAGLNYQLRQAAELGLITNTAAESAVGLSMEVQASLARQLATEGKLTVEDVRQARLAVRKRQFPAGSLFASFDSEPADNWQAMAAEHLATALEWIPEDWLEIRETLTQILADIQE